MFDKSGAKIDYGNPPIQEVLQISSDNDDVTENLNNDSDSESLTIQPNFVSVMNSYDWKYKVNIPIQFANEFLGLDGMLVDIHGTGSKKWIVHYVTRFSKDGVFKKARFEKGWNVFVHKNQLAEDDEVDFMLDVAANDDRVVFNIVITRSG
ncbi:hypothetical protein GH714_004139 [Hevea brasiliensis]|uniref:TF-B3 domain-containing protein n=1 Tax=Hevea brasiliensis TaxID=3981 RepID=A0A6A6LBK6_HEVBR|nr:hypothetical protein GH714_004139 [Hevea brasiliensis]